MELCSVNPGSCPPFSPDSRVSCKTATILQQCHHQMTIIWEFTKRCFIMLYFIKCHCTSCISNKDVTNTIIGFNIILNISFIYDIISEIFWPSNTSSRNSNILNLCHLYRFMINRNLIRQIALMLLYWLIVALYHVCSAHKVQWNWVEY